jgi:hypothetical protein
VINKHILYEEITGVVVRFRFRFRLVISRKQRASWLPQEAIEFVVLGIVSRKEMAQIQNDFLGDCYAESREQMIFGIRTK